jgi:hypothetical protein
VLAAVPQAHRSVRPKVGLKVAALDHVNEILGTRA